MNQTSFYSPRPPALAALMQYDCTTIGQYTSPPPTSPLHAMHNTILVMAISCKGQAKTDSSAAAIFRSPVKNVISSSAVYRKRVRALPVHFYTCMSIP